MYQNDTNLSQMQIFALEHAASILQDAFPDFDMQLIGDEWHFIVTDDERFAPRRPLQLVRQAA